MATRSGHRFAGDVSAQRLSGIMWIWIALAVLAVTLSIVARAYPG